jgi:hypothetical protein
MSDSINTLYPSGPTEKTPSHAVSVEVPSAVNGVFPGHLASGTLPQAEPKDFEERMHTPVSGAFEMTKADTEHAQDIKVTSLGNGRIKVEYPGGEKIFNIKRLKMGDRTLSADEIESHLDLVAELVKKVVLATPHLNIQALKSLQIRHEQVETKRGSTGSQVSVQTTSAGPAGDIKGEHVFKTKDELTVFGDIFDRIKDAATNSLKQLKTPQRGEEVILPDEPSSPDDSPTLRPQ